MVRVERYNAQSPHGSAFGDCQRFLRMNATSAFIGSPWFRRLRNASLILIALLAAYALLGFFALPWLAKPKVESLATEAFGRTATLGKLEFNPFTLRARLSDFALADREPNHALLRFELLDVDMSSASLWKWAPVFDAVRFVRPKLELVRAVDDTYNVQDLIGRQRAEPKGPTPAFSINNIEVEDGSLLLDDRKTQRSIAVTNLGIGIPFLSSLPYDAQIRVTPKFDGVIDGARFNLAGNATTPFADTEEATLELNLDALSLPPYAAYAPLPHGLKLTDGALTTRLTLAFVTANGAPRALTLSGTTRLDRLAIAHSDSSPLAAAKVIEVAINKFDPLGHSIALDRVTVNAPEVDLRRFSDGTIEFERLLDAPAPAGKAANAGEKTVTASAPPWAFSIADLHLADGILHIFDEGVAPAFRVTLSSVRFDAKKIASHGEGTADVAFDSNTGAHFAAHGDVDPAGKAARGHFSLTTFHLDALYPYYAEALNLDVRRGALDLAADFAVGASPNPMQLTLTQGAATLADLEMAVHGESDPLWRIPRADLGGVAFDYAKRNITIDKVESQRPAFRVVRQADGVVNFERLVRTSATTGAAPDATRTAAADSGWAVLIHKLLLERIAADFEDRAVQPPVKLRFADARITVDNYSNAGGAKSTLAFATRVGSTGRVQFNGAFATNPVTADWRINASGLDLVSLRPYFEARTNVIVTSGTLGAKGRLTYGAAERGPTRATYTGDLTIQDFGSLDRPTSQELLRWKSLTLTAIDAASEPLKVALGAITLDAFYARVIVNPDATLNLQRLLAPESATAEAATTVVSGDAATVAVKEPPPTAASDKELPVSIGRIQLSSGEVQFSDFFVKPNYSAHLTDVVGNVSALSATQAGDVEVAARVETTAPVEIHGSLNPFARELTLDLTATARDVDLPPLTPYSAKYAGYGIEKGKLSLEVHYKVDNRKLAASNKLVLDQLTFGEHVDSPTATKLPVRLAVSLLKDRNGVIHLDLPIQGTLDDPKFSVWGVLVQIFVNLITKIITAPFAVLGSLAGGGGDEQLAYIEFAPGHAELSSDAEAKLRSLAKALADRPALKLDAAGRAVPEVDRDGLKRVALDRAMRVQKQKTLASQGGSAPSVDALNIDAAEYPKFLALVYRDATLPDKPRNVIGMAKDIPPAEMEALLLASYSADEGALRSLATRRALAVQEWFVGPGGIPSERVFVVAAKLNGDGIADKGAPTRVDFAIH
jgi:uncharacterized protein involved in outer membrane biogenesis